MERQLDEKDRSSTTISFFAVGYQVSFVIYNTEINFFMDLTNTEGIECLECITVFSEVSSKLSGNLHLFCTQLCKGKKKLLEM